jgi:regulator of protease activity HflC (stomatin/prohibitin superfamily)
VQSLKLQITDLETRTIALPKTHSSRTNDARIAALEAELEAERSRALGTASQETQALQSRLAAAAEEKRRIAEAAADLETKLIGSKSQCTVLVRDRAGQS